MFLLTSTGHGRVTAITETVPDGHRGATLLMFWSTTHFQEKFLFASGHPVQELGALNGQSDLDFTPHYNVYS